MTYELTVLMENQPYGVVRVTSLIAQMECKMTSMWLQPTKEADLYRLSIHVLCDEIRMKQLLQMLSRVIGVIEVDASSLQEVVTDGILATPRVRKLAREKGVLLKKVTGTGRNEQVTCEDILKFAAAQTTFLPKMG